MKYLVIASILFFSILFVSCDTSQEPRQFSINLIPQPVKAEVHDGSMELNNDTRIIFASGNKELAETASLMADFLRERTGLDISTSDNLSEKNNVICLALDPDLENLTKEGYTLFIDQVMIELSSTSPEGIFRGFQTLRQLLPAEIEKIDGASGKSIFVPAMEIIDQPRFGWRGMLLDCGRHFMSVDFVKRYIDLLAYHKMNVLHWHLTEDQGWRIEIKKYPRLTEVGAWRTYDDGTRYGGFYTQEQIREVVEYARKRYVTIIPEIEMPGHSVAALAAYPEYSCTGGPFEVETAWGVHKDVYCAGKEETFQFLEDVLTEVMELFPGKYIHIGGDECPKDRWKECPDCQARIKEEGLKDEHELQSWFITRIEKFLNSHGRQIIGWDEILEGGLAPGATVQSWRGMKGAIEAAKSGHDAIASPTSHAYFDYPLENIDLEKVYNFDPIPEELSEDEAKHILGGECNMWTERAPQELVDSKVFPRILAMSEVLWSYPYQRDYEAFRQKVQAHYPRLDNMGVNYGPESKPVTIEVEAKLEKGNYSVVLKPGETGLDIYYSLDGKAADKQAEIYSDPFTISSSKIITAQAFKNGKLYGKPESLAIVTHLGIGKEVDYLNKYNRYYPGGGDFALVDGFKGHSEKHNDGHWQAWAAEDMNVIIDLGEILEINGVSVDFMSKVSSWIHLPSSVSFYVSEHRKKFIEIGHVEYQGKRPTDEVFIHTFSLKKKVKGRYLQVVAKSLKVNPPGHSAAGEDAWIFCDEIIIE
jgi:hexosaminidase